MKKGLKYTLIAALLCVIGGGSWVTYIFFIKDYETADQNVDEIVDSDFDIKLPEEDSSEMVTGNSSGSQEKGNDTNHEETEIHTITNEKKDTNQPNESQRKTSSNVEKDKNSSNSMSHDNDGTSDHVSNDQTSKSNQTSGNSQETSKQQSTNQDEKEHASSQKEKPTVEEIKAKYRPSFEALQDQALSKLNVLISYAHNEYKKKKNNGSKVSYGYFYNKYKAAAKKLEAKTDATFNSLYVRLQNELSSYGYSKQEAQDIKQFYDQQKSKRENALLSRVLDKF